MAHKGTSTFIIQRATAALLIPICIWFLLNVASHLGADYETARAWISKPLNGSLLGAFLTIGALHMRIGMAEIIVDYIHSWVKDVLLVVNWLVTLGLITTVAWSIYTLSFSG